MKKVVKTEEEWRNALTPEQFRITRLKGTERAYSGPYWNNKDTGMYHCVCCGAELFSSETKYESCTGWPSFYDPVASDRVEFTRDSTLGMERIEVTCKQCGAHLGHVFDDGPQPTGMRYCLNGTALKFTKP